MKIKRYFSTPEDEINYLKTKINKQVIEIQTLFEVIKKKDEIIQGWASRYDKEIITD